MKNLTESEQKLVNWLRSEFGNRTELAKKQGTIYDRLLNYYPNLLNIALPHKHSPNDTKSEIIIFALEGRSAPSQAKGCNRKLAQRYQSYIRKSHKSFDGEFKEFLMDLRPDWFISHHEKNFWDCLKNKMPKNVVLLPNQRVGFNLPLKWEIDGKIIQRKLVNMLKSWEIGLSGHPDDAKDSLVRHNLKYTDDDIIKSASRYTSVKEWVENEGAGIYQAAFERGLLKDLHMKRKSRPSLFTEERAKKEVLKYKNAKELKKQNPKLYVYISNSGKRKEFFKHMKPINGVAKRIKCIQTGEIYESSSQAARDLGFSGNSSIVAVLKGRKKSAGGYTFKYVDEEE